MTTNANNWLWAVLIVYFVFCIYLGVRAYKKQKKSSDAEEECYDFWITGRTQTAHTIAMSISSGWMLLGVITWQIWAVYDLGLSGLWVECVPYLLLLVVTYLMIPHFRKIKAISIPQMLQNRFGPQSRYLLSGISIFTCSIWAGAELYAASLIMAPALGISVKLMIILYSIPLVIYMALGGFRSVMNASILQFIMGGVFLIVVAVCVVVVAHGIVSGQGTTIIGALKETPIINSMEYTLKDTTETLTLFGFLTASFPVAAILCSTIGCATEGDYWLKIQSTPTTAEAKKGARLNIVYNTFIVVLPAAIIGLMGLVIFPPVVQDGVVYSAEILGDQGGYNVLSVFVNTYLPIWARMLIIFLISAHSLAAISTFGNVCALNMSYDILQPLVYRPRKWSGERIMKWSRGITVLVLIYILALALLFDSSFGGGLNSIYFVANGFLTAGAAVMIFPLFWKRANLPGVMVGGISGVSATIIFYILESQVFKYSYTMPVWDWIFGKGSLASTYLGFSTVGLAFGIIGLIIGTYVTSPPSKEQLDAIGEEPIDDTEEFFKGVKQTS